MLEAVYHLPVSVWAIRGFLRGMYTYIHIYMYMYMYILYYTVHIYAQHVVDSSIGRPDGWMLLRPKNFFVFTTLCVCMCRTILKTGRIAADDPMVPVHILMWSVQTFVTTSTCLAEVWEWTDRTTEQKYNITSLYAPYILLGESYIVHYV